MVRRVGGEGGLLTIVCMLRPASARRGTTSRSLSLTLTIGPPSSPGNELSNFVSSLRSGELLTRDELTRS